MDERHVQPLPAPLRTPAIAPEHDDLATRVEPGIEVVFIDTGYHFPETLETVEADRPGCSSGTGVGAPAAVTSLADLGRWVRGDGLEIVPVSHVDEVLSEALIDAPRSAARIKAERAQRQKTAVRRPRRRTSSDVPVAAKTVKPGSEQPPAGQPAAWGKRSESSSVRCSFLLEFVRLIEALSLYHANPCLPAREFRLLD